MTTPFTELELSEYNGLLYQEITASVAHNKVKQQLADFEKKHSPEKVHAMWLALCKRDSTS